MDEMVFTITDEGPERSWWVGDGLWWLLVEGFGLVSVHYPATNPETP